MSQVTVRYSGLSEPPKYETPGSAGCDLKSSVVAVIQPHERMLVPTGLFVAIPFGCEGQIRARSGLAYKHGITVLNGVGTIDQDYRGEIKVLLINHGTEAFYINVGDRIAQFVISPVMHAKFVKIDALDDTERGQGGFGSTGTRKK